MTAFVTKKNHWICESCEIIGDKSDSYDEALAKVVEHNALHHKEAA